MENIHRVWTSGRPEAEVILGSDDAGPPSNDRLAQGGGGFQHLACRADLPDEEAIVIEMTGKPELGSLRAADLIETSY